MLKYLIPRFALRDLPPMLILAGVGGVVAGIYGVVHDQATYTISPEYFTKFKFLQFHYADFGFSDRVFAGEIGFLAGFPVGFVIAWFLARRLIARQPRRSAVRQIAIGFVVVFCCALLSALLGFAYGLWLGPDVDYSAWNGVARNFDIEDRWAFIRVAYIHNASYLGGLIGLIAALVVLRPRHMLDVD